MTTALQRGEQADAAATGVLARTAEAHTDDEVRPGRDRARRASHDDDGRLERPVDLAELLAPRSDLVAVVALTDVPAAVGVRGRRARRLRGTAAEKRHGCGVESDRAVKAVELLVAHHLHRGLHELSDHCREAAARLGDLVVGELSPHLLRASLVHDAVLLLDRGIHHRQREVEQVADLSVAGEEGLSPVRRADDT
jgi:hypothetical protein